MKHSIKMSQREEDNVQRLCQNKEAKVVFPKLSKADIANARSAATSTTFELLQTNSAPTKHRKKQSPAKAHSPPKAEVGVTAIKSEPEGCTYGMSTQLVGLWVGRSFVVGENVLSFRFITASHSHSHHSVVTSLHAEADGEQYDDDDIDDEVSAKVW